MRKYILLTALCIGILATVSACTELSEDKPAVQQEEEQKGQEEEYSDGIYRGFYYENEIEQISVQFELKDGMFADVTLRSIKYKDGNYLSGDATDIQKQIAAQYKQAARYLIGKDTSAINDLQDPTLVAEDMDAVTSATLNTNKMAAAMKDGLERNVFRMLSNSRVKSITECPDGVYRGVYNDGGVEQIAVKFEIKDNKFVDVTYESLNYGEKNYLDENSKGVSKQIAKQYKQAAEYLIGKEISALQELYYPGELLEDYDAVSGATLKTNKLISAINDGFANGAKTDKWRDK